MIEWSRAFGEVPIYLHVADEQWVMRPDKAIVFWDGEAKVLGNDLTLVDVAVILMVVRCCTGKKV